MKKGCPSLADLGVCGSVVSCSSTVTNLVHSRAAKNPLAAIVDFIVVTGNEAIAITRLITWHVCS